MNAAVLDEYTISKLISVTRDLLARKSLKLKNKTNVDEKRK